MRNTTGSLIAILCAVTAAAGSAAAQSPAPAAAAPAAAPATSAAAQLQPGATIYDTTGAEVAKVVTVTDAGVNVDTGTNKLTIPAASFGPGANGPILNASKAQLDAAATQAAESAKAALAAQLAPGTQVRGQSGQTVIGSIKSVTGDLVLISTPEGEVNVPATSFLAGPNGPLLQMTADDFNKAVAAAKG